MAGRFEKAAAEAGAKAGKGAPPTYDVYVVDGDADKGYRTKVGAAWPHADGRGYGVALVALPVGAGRLVLRAREQEVQ